MSLTQRKSISLLRRFLSAFCFFRFRAGSICVGRPRCHFRRHSSELEAQGHSTFLALEDPTALYCSVRPIALEPPLRRRSHGVQDPLRCTIVASEGDISSGYELCTRSAANKTMRVTLATFHLEYYVTRSLPHAGSNFGAWLI